MKLNELKRYSAPAVTVVGLQFRDPMATNEDEDDTGGGLPFPAVSKQPSYTDSRERREIKSAGEGSLWGGKSKLGGLWE